MGVILDSCVWVGLTSGQVESPTVIAATGDAPVYRLLRLPALHSFLELRNTSV